MTMQPFSRRIVLAGLMTLPATRLARSQSPAATPACGSLTLAQTEGPYFKASTPERSSLLEPGMAGDRLLLSGTVSGRDCAPLANATVELWQADAAGEYDNRGYRLRGHVRTDANGRYRFETVVPGLYPGRTRHYHVKVIRPDGGRVLTTQLYFPDEPGNRRDGIFNAALLMRIDGTSPRNAAFDFVLA
jgi:protocatechuate 3,4-dioxygenase beta subunit